MEDEDGFDINEEDVQSLFDLRVEETEMKKRLHNKRWPG